MRISSWSRSANHGGSATEKGDGAVPGARGCRRRSAAQVDDERYSSTKVRSGAVPRCRRGQLWRSAAQVQNEHCSSTSVRGGAVLGSPWGRRQSSAQVEDERCFSTSVRGGDVPGSPRVSVGWAAAQRRWRSLELSWDRRWSSLESSYRLVTTGRTVSKGGGAGKEKRPNHPGGGALKRRVEARCPQPLLAGIATTDPSF